VSYCRGYCSVVVDAVIVVGIGDFPRNVVQQTRAYIVGEPK